MHKNRPAQAASDSQAEPWLTESREVTWIHETTGYTCHVKRQPAGFLCGYVEVPIGHPLHGVQYDWTIPASLVPAARAVLAGPVGQRGILDCFIQADRPVEQMRAGFLFDVHGGITFTGPAYWDHELGWWFGFDCGHAGDLSPRLGTMSGDVYRNMPFVRAQCESLAEQLEAIA